MSFTYKYTIRYDYSSTEEPIVSKIPNEYISMYVKNKRPAPKRLITCDISKSPYSVNCIIIRWEGEIQEGYTHIFPERLPCNCFVKIEYAVPRKNYHRDSVSIPYIMNALVVIGDLIPLELDSNERFLALIGWYIPRNPLRHDFSDEEEVTKISYKRGYFRRDIPSELFIKIQEIVSEVDYDDRMI